LQYDLTRKYCPFQLPEGATRPEVRRDNGLFMGHAYSITALSVVTHW